MKTLTLFLLSLATLCVTAGAQESAAPAGSTTQADKKFLQQLERTDPPANRAQSAGAPADPAAGQPATASTDEKRPKSAPVAKKSRHSRNSDVKPVDPAVAQERPQAVDSPNDQFVPTRPVKRENQERTARTGTLFPFFDNGGRAPAGAAPKNSKTSAPSTQSPPEVAAGSPKTVTVTKTVTIIPQPTPKSADDGFFHRLFSHKDRSGD